MWIGEVPLVLRLLTLPERILVARFFPAAYIVKLYPAKKGARSWPSSGFHSGIRGNVSTYRLNTEDIAEMTDSQIMPPSSTILAATIGITFIGPRNLPERTMPGFLQVNRRRVHDALLWLKENNPVYHNIIISVDRLNELPQDDVPVEISCLMKLSDNVDQFVDENNGYVPDYDDDFEPDPDNDDGKKISCINLPFSFLIISTASLSDPVVDDRDYSMEPPSENNAECAIPLQALGVVDVAANEVPDNELLANTLANISRADKTGGWAVRRSSDFVNEYPRLDDTGNRFSGSSENPNHLLGSFPCLFPFGLGGFEVGRVYNVSYETHARWALRYEDHRFRTDLHFMFQIFGVIQKRRMCASAALQISKQSFLRFESAIRNLDSAAFERAAKEEHARENYSDPTMISLRETITAVRTKVDGTDEARIRIRSLVWGMCIKKNPPSLWLTINPTDTQNPIARMFAGEEIDLDHYCALDHHPIVGAVAGDLFASALFFHTIINAVIHYLLGIQGYDRHQTLRRKKGIFSTVSAFVGTVEAQGQGTLHLHMLLWLEGAVTTSKMKELLSTEHFRDRITNFLAANISGDIANLDGPSILSLPKDKTAAFSRPVDPRLADYETSAHAAEIATARMVQVHQCTHACLRIIKGRWRCKRRAPFALADAPWINDRGDWGIKRRYGYVNGFCPSLLQAVRCNHDLKLVTNGEETKKIAWYFTNYETKILLHSTNTSALLAKTFRYHRVAESYTSDLHLLNKRLIQRCANTLTREREIGAPEVVSYLMGWGDRFISHHFETIYWFSVISMLKKCYPILTQSFARSVLTHSFYNLLIVLQKSDRPNDCICIKR